MCVFEWVFGKGNVGSFWDLHLGSGSWIVLDSAVDIWVIFAYFSKEDLC